MKFSLFCENHDLNERLRVTLSSLTVVLVLTLLAMREAIFSNFSS